MDHLSEQIINQYRQRSLGPVQLLEVDEHLADCDRCHLLWAKGNSDVNESSRTLYEGILSADPTSDDHLSYETLEALVDDKVSDVDREIAAVHLDACSQCTAELAVLEELRDQKPITLPSQVFVHRSSLFARGNWSRLAVATFAILLVAASLWIVWNSRRSLKHPTDNQLLASESPTPVNLRSPAVTPSPSPSPETLVTLHDAGETVTVDATGKLEGLTGISPNLKAAVKTALTTEELNVGPALSGLKGKGGTLMGSGNEGKPFRLLSPVGIVVQSDQPTFRWEPYEGANVYVVKVYDSDFKEMANSLSQTQTSWKIPLPLTRGGVYTWQVTAIKDGQEIKSPTAPAPQVLFRILAKDKLDEIKRVQSVKPPSHLALGTLYAETGLLDYARREFRILLQANPDSKVVQKLLQEVTNR